MYGDMEPNIEPVNNKKRGLIIACAVLLVAFVIFGVFNIFKIDSIFRNGDIGDNSNYYTVKINLNGASSVSEETVSCKIQDGGCYVTLPDAKREGGTVLGYSDNMEDHKVLYNLSSKIFLNGNKELYVISYVMNNLTIDDKNIDYLAANNLSCVVYNTTKSCKVTLPRYNKIGYENKGYSTSIDSLAGFIYAGDEYDLSGNVTMYPIYSTSSRHQSINISKVLEYNGSFIEIEKGCDASIYKDYLSYLDEIKQKTPYMLMGNKITFLIDKTFDDVWGSKFVGMNYGPKSLRSVDVRCSNVVNNDYYATMVHEMAHSWDFYYARRLGDNISSQSDIINLYNKYKNQSNRPFRDYSFSSIYEFVADMMRYYYFKTYVPRAPFKNLSYPSDIKTSLEKYICISKNDYDEGKCK